jgi:hypothetical protein
MRSKHLSDSRSCLVCLHPIPSFFFFFLHPENFLSEIPIRIFFLSPEAKESVIMVRDHKAPTYLHLLSKWLKQIFFLFSSSQILNLFFLKICQISLLGSSM